MKLTHGRRLNRWTFCRCSRAGSSPSWTCRRSAVASWCCCCSYRDVVLDEGDAPRSLVNGEHPRWYLVGVATVNSTPNVGYPLGKTASIDGYKYSRSFVLRRVLVSTERKTDDQTASSTSSCFLAWSRSDEWSWTMASRTLTSGASLRLIRDKISSASIRRGARKLTTFLKIIKSARGKKARDLKVWKKISR